MELKNVKSTPPNLPEGEEQKQELRDKKQDSVAKNLSQIQTFKSEKWNMSSNRFSSKINHN